MISTHLKKFRSTILAAVALLAIIGTVVALPDSAEAGRREPTITSVDMTITPTAVSHRDFKQVDISFTWKARPRGTGYKIDRRERIHVADSPSGEAEWSEWDKAKYISTTERVTTIEEMDLDFTTTGTQVEWRIKLQDRNDKWSGPHYVSVSWGIKKKEIFQYVIKSDWFTRN